MKRGANIILMIFMVFLLFQTNVFAQDEPEPDPGKFVVFDPETGEYTLNLDVLTPTGMVVKDPPEEWKIPSKTFQVGDNASVSFGKMVYNQYVSPEGYYVLVPTLYTAIVMSLNDESPFDTNPVGGVVNGWAGVAGSFDWLEGIGYTREDVITGDWKYDPVFWNELFKVVNDPKNPLFQGAFFAPPAVLIFEGDPFASPINHQNVSIPIPPPPASTCPDPKIVDAEIKATGELVDPPYPVVVGQDPNKRGADLLWRVEITPVAYTWYETKEVIEDKICRYVGEGNGSGCPGPESEYSRVIGSNGGWKPWMADNDAWLEEGGVSQIECIKHVEVYPVQLSWVRTYANLSEESRDWIEHGGLQQRYPGAHLYQPDWQWLPPLYGNVLNNGVYVWEWSEEDIQFRDPGQYGMSVRGSITGTPVTKPRVFNMEASGFSMWLYEATLTQ